MLYLIGCYKGSVCVSNTSFTSANNQVNVMLMKIHRRTCIMVEIDWSVCFQPNLFSHVFIHNSISSCLHINVHEKTNCALSIYLHTLYTYIKVKDFCSSKRNQDT